MDRLLTMFSYNYMIRAFIAGVLVSILVSCLGNVMVHKRLSMIGDSLAHTSLAGVAIGLVLAVSKKDAPAVLAMFNKNAKKYHKAGIEDMVAYEIGYVGHTDKVIKGEDPDAVSEPSFWDKNGDSIMGAIDKVVYKVLNHWGAFDVSLSLKFFNLWMKLIWRK